MKRNSTKKKSRKSGQEGQVIVEFIIVFTMILTMIFLFVEICWGMAIGHYVHYATYMASRAYMAGGQTHSDQTDAATKVLNTMLKNGGKDIFGFMAPSRAGGERDTTGPEPVKGAMVGTHPEMIGKEHSRVYSWAEGVQYNYNLRVFLLPISKVVTGGGTGKTIQTGTPQAAGKSVVWKGMIPFTSDSFLGREVNYDECIRDLNHLSGTGIARQDGQPFIEDNGC
jgi:TadE-like protein